MMRAWLLVPNLLALMAQPPAQAAIHIRVDPASGVTILSNVPAPQRPGTAAASMPVPVRASARGTTAAFPIVDARVQQERDRGRRAILENELATEQLALATARQHGAADDVLNRHLANLAALRRELHAIR